MTKHIPIKQHRVKQKNQPQWLSPEILDAMKCRDRHKSIGNEDEYKLQKNQTIQMIQKAKRKKKNQTFLDNNKNNPSSIYKIFQEVGAGKSLRKQSTTGSVKVGDTFF